MVLRHSHDLRRRMKKGDCALARASEEATRPSTNGGRSYVSRPSRQCADFAHFIGEIAESAKVLGRFWPSVQKLHMHTFSSAK